ncbi:hypothetical protein COCSUDRAFT_34547 [Coccomyxa subellipsoidea C-169]|uniref:Uncharacterized protein n=1 Tax=Coccomyxa subellipsoidea (strain C-169) TaxID=574566 RepID=I0YIZ3_COCSC|nr:hypothetical protein COCSUDRAFT_34547 [Coccomyxa subellipsoidea C-169]EIE18362.1 hypothetical protein COCSUDRAFT_34547 [Coccomyxa subellipsoidea C-169]|eukprot:XP_005642906.1 hypothetical protein COCSUDRAFT_34547 [Coccomyxa subellipsoidea C-169]
MLLGILKEESPLEAPQRVSGVRIQFGRCHDRGALLTFFGCQMVCSSASVCRGGVQVFCMREMVQGLKLEMEDERTVQVHLLFSAARTVMKRQKQRTKKCAVSYLLL